MQVLILLILHSVLAMIKLIRSYFFLIFLLVFSATSSFAQFINIQLTIEPELSTRIEQSLNFGTQVTNSGIKQINLGDSGMGIFSIKALYTQEVKISLNYPENLESLENNAKIPLDLSISYNNSGRDLPEESILIPNNSSYISIYNREESLNPDQIWKELFIYVFGSIDVGAVPNADYEADVILNVDYN